MFLISFIESIICVASTGVAAQTQLLLMGEGASSGMSCFLVF